MSRDRRKGPASSPQDDERPAYRSHLIPRTAAGRRAVLLFLALFAPTQPPIVHWVAAVHAPLFGIPFLYLYLLALYVALIGVLLWAYRKGV